MAKAQLITISCSRRSLELEQVKGFLRGNGFSLSGSDWAVDPHADWILISTCGFTQAAEDAGFEMLRQVEARKKPGARVVFGGCIPEIHPARVAREFEGPTFSPQSYSRLDTILGAKHGFDEFPRPNTFGQAGTPALIRDGQRAVEILKTFDGSLSALGYISQRLGNGLRRRLIRAKFANLYNCETFYVQIQEGCSMDCSYCAIRLAIGPLRSRPIGVVLAELESGLARGYRRFQLMGDNAGSYGLDLGTNMAHLLRRILTLEGDFALDLTDINPVYLPLVVEEVKQLLLDGRLSCLYTPIQSSSRRLLKLMNRDCDIEAVGRMLREIRSLAPADFRLGTSLIVGFPSETVSELEDTVQFCKSVGFDWTWCHSFSARPDTRAAALPGQWPPEETLRRARLVKSWLAGKSLVTTADDTEGSRTCQG